MNTYWSLGEPSEKISSQSLSETEWFLLEALVGVVAVVQEEACALGFPYPQWMVCGGFITCTVVTLSLRERTRRRLSYTRLVGRDGSWRVADGAWTCSDVCLHVNARSQWKLRVCVRTHGSGRLPPPPHARRVAGRHTPRNRMPYFTSIFTALLLVLHSCINPLFTPQLPNQASSTSTRLILLIIQDPKFSASFYVMQQKPNGQRFCVHLSLLQGYVNVQKKPLFCQDTL